VNSGNQRRLARYSHVRLPGGGSIETPILIPSFSSKGFRVDKDGNSEVRDLLEFALEWLTDSMLISAYDIHHGHIPKPGEMAKAPELTVVDSGGYEARIDHDLSTSVHLPHAPRDWNEKLLDEVLSSWPTRFAAAFVTYDDASERHPFAEQLQAGRAFITRYPDQLHTMLVKPETDTQKYLTKTLQQACMSAGELAAFDFIGVTEKELGPSMLERMHELAKLRLALDDAGVTRPIHVFGAPDPLTSSLYFLAGAEVFDGLTWLRYAFRDGLCIYQANNGVLRIGTDRRDDRVRAQTLTENVHSLPKLRAQMRRFTLDQDFAQFEHNADALRSEYDSLRAKLKGKI
jgi:hypothetical protein